MSLHFRPLLTQEEIPASFTFPFDYEPHSVALLAAQVVMKDLGEIPASIHDFEEIGKMFGVLVVKDLAGKLGYLTAFSGKLQCGNHYSYFVPPIFDMLDEKGFYRKGEEELNELNHQIKELENDTDLCCLKSNYNRSLQDLEFELEEAKDEFRNGKVRRKAVRQELEAEKRLLELAAVKVAHEKESHHQQFVIKNLKVEIRDLEDSRDDVLLPFQSRLQNLKEQRKVKSNQLQQQLFEQYNFLNSKGEVKNVLEIFHGQIPPAGTGECAAPKLLQFAYQHQLQPIAMAEFWWGISPPKEVRKNGEFYPSCKSKCEPVLGFMLQGLKVDEDPRANMEISEELETIYEDDYLLVVNKPAKMLSAPGKINVPNVYDLIKEKYPEATGPLLVHRLDQSTSGILLIAKDKETHAALQKQFEERTTQKRYEAILDGIIEVNSGKIELPLRVDLDNRPRQLVDFEHGKPAETYFKVIEIKDGKTRIHFFPVTGRTHQLRVHSAHQQGLNAPILGDDLYGNRAERLHLHAAQLTIVHPKTGEEVTFKSEVPF
ncbi:MAG: RNA pseudouridine synthase [Flavobacteriales bacterium]|nr:RNA pseudouridine synthase [Flavobacteriales bacterium]